MTRSARNSKQARKSEIGDFARAFRNAFGLVCVAIMIASAGAAAMSHAVAEPFDGISYLLPGLVAIVGLGYLRKRFWTEVVEGLGSGEVMQAIGAAHRYRSAQTKSENSDASVKSKMISLAYTDQLTGLGNKVRMAEKFRRLTEKGSSEAFTVGLMNLDGMKPINDLFGSHGGDEILKQCAQRLFAAIENDGFVYRYGGDEFGFIYPEVTEERGALEKGRLLQNVLQAPYDIENRKVRLSGSFGFAVFPYAGREMDELIANIDTALYHSKRNGRGRITVYTREVEEMMRENAKIEQALRQAIANNEVKPHFQPIISLQDGKLLGFESLARWVDPELGFVPPARFIPLAEERGIISILTDSLLLQAARVAAEWPEELFLSFNLSSVQLVDPSTAANIKEVVRRAGLKPHRLEIEVTETAMMSDPETAAMIVEELHRAGIRISMDDFGTGQSSLGRLRELNLDKVKIDRAFIMAIGEDKPAEHIVRAILEMCEGLRLTVVAEGIEEIGQAESLKKYGCHAGQGYLFGKPQDARRTMSYIRDFLVEDGKEGKMAASA